MSTHKTQEPIKRLSNVVVGQGKEKQLLTEKEAAKFLGLTSSALQVWRSTGRYSLPFIKVGSLVRYRESDLFKWLESRTHSNGSTV